jgi:hypothetical protein
LIIGRFHLLTIGKKIDVDNFISITPYGYLQLNLTRSWYQKLGLQGKPTNFESKRHSRYSKCQKIIQQFKCLHYKTFL